MEDTVLDEKFQKSSKSYGVAVCISAIFGILGIHHFYLERWAMGLFDLTLSIGGFYLIWFGSDNLKILGFGLIIIDVIHTFYVTYKLLVGEYADGKGLIVAYPGQKKIQQSKKL